MSRLTTVYVAWVRWLYDIKQVGRYLMIRLFNFCLTFGQQEINYLPNPYLLYYTHYNTFLSCVPKPQAVHPKSEIRESALRFTPTPRLPPSCFFIFFHSSCSIVASAAAACSLTCLGPPGSTIGDP